VAIYLCFNLKCMEETKTTWRVAKFEPALKRLNLMSNLRNYKNYRGFIADKKPPLIPYIDSTLKDILYIDHKQPDFFDDDKKVINIPKLDAIGKLIESFRLCQTKQYPFQVFEELYNKLYNLPQIDNDKLLEVQRNETNLIVDDSTSKISDESDITVNDDSTSFSLSDTKDDFSKKKKKSTSNANNSNTARSNNSTSNNNNAPKKNLSYLLYLKFNYLNHMNYYGKNMITLKASEPICRS